MRNVLFAIVLFAASCACAANPVRGAVRLTADAVFDRLMAE